MNINQVKNRRVLVSVIVGLATIVAMGWYVNTYIYQFLAAFPQVAVEVQPYEPILNGTVAPKKITQVLPNSEFNIKLSATNQPIDTMDIYLTYDATKIEYLGTYTQFPNAYFTDPVISQVTTVTGTNKKQLHILLTSFAATRSNLAQINFKFKSLTTQGKAAFTIESKSQITGVDLRGSSTPFDLNPIAPTGEITILSITQITSTPTARPTVIATIPAATATRIPTATATRAPVATATRIPTATVTRPPVATATRIPTPTNTPVPATSTCGNSDCSNKMYSVVPVIPNQNAEQICVAKGWGHCAVCNVGYGPATIHGYKPNTGSWSNSCPGAALGSFNPTSMEVCCTMKVTVTPTRIPTATRAPTLTPTRVPTTVVATVTATKSPTPPPVNTCLRKNEGDANCDGKVNILDAVCWRSEMIGRKALNCVSSDFNNDKKISVVDIPVWRSTYIKENTVKK